MMLLNGCIETSPIKCELRYLDTHFIVKRTILIHSDAPAKGYLILVKHRLVYQLMPSHFNACFVMPIYVAKQIK